MVLSLLFGSKPATDFATPPETRIYAIGDIHGRIDLLRALHQSVLDDAGAKPCPRNVLVYLGDYIDRGNDSREVIELILEAPLPGFETVHLAGNHEDFMMTFLADPAVGPRWFVNGGDTTLLSYGVGYPKDTDHEDRLGFMRTRLLETLPDPHLAFLKSLKPYHLEGDYLFVHAGIRPGRAVEKQDREDLLWIRDEFLRSGADHGKCVVHGHTITAEVDVQPNRIGIDTGAYVTGTLTCLVLEGTERHVLQT